VYNNGNEPPLGATKNKDPSLTGTLDNSRSQHGALSVQDSSEIAQLSVEAGEAVAQARGIVAHASAGTVATSFVSESLKGVRTRRTLPQGAAGAAPAGITHTAHVLPCVPRDAVGAHRILGQDAFWQALALIVTIVGTRGALACYTLVACETITSPQLAVAGTLVGALGPWVKVVGTHHMAHPSEALRTRAL
jgi:hypothetical protein